MTYCRVCGESTSVYVCGSCVEAWRVLVRRAYDLLEDMAAEVERAAVKAKGGGSGNGKTEAVALGALEAKWSLERALSSTRSQVGSPAPELVYGRVHVVQERPREVDGLHDDYRALEDAVRTCASMVDVRETRVTVGVCACGSEVAAYPSQESAKCHLCGRVDPVQVFANRRRHVALARVRGRRLSREELKIYLKTALPGCKDGAIRLWVHRRHLVPDDDGFYSESEVRAFVESRVKKYSTPLDL